MVYRVYFNAHADFPLVCSIDTGDDSPEMNFKSVMIVGDGVIKSEYRPSRQPKFWLEVSGTLRSFDGHAVIQQEAL